MRDSETLGEMRKAGTKITAVLREKHVTSGMESMSLSLAKYAGENLDVPEVEIGLDEVATIFFTSGSFCSHSPGLAAY